MFNCLLEVIKFIIPMNEFKKIVRNNRIALVGNASSIFSLKNGYKIDACDIVIRINAGFVKDSSAQGSRTDVWVTSLYVPMLEVKTKFDPKLVVWATSKRRLFPSEYLDEFKVEFHPLWEWVKLRFTLGYRPTTGAIVANYIFSKCKPKVVHIFGFDNFASPTFYHNRANIGPHSGEAERILFNKFYKSRFFINEN
jgi:hypothetical protein